MNRTFQGRTDEVLILHVTPFLLEKSKNGTLHVRHITAVKLDNYVARTYEENIFVPLNTKEKIIRVVQNKTNGLEGSIGFEFSDIQVE